jgi:hypothetical protein
MLLNVHPSRRVFELSLPSIGEDRKTYYRIRTRFFDPGVCPRIGSVASSGTLPPVFGPGRRHVHHGSFGFESRIRVRPCARRSLSGVVLHLKVRTILPSGPLLAIASFGSSEGHSLSVGSPGLGPWTMTEPDTHLRTDCAPAPRDDCLSVRLPNRGVAYALRSDSVARRYLSGL